MGIKSISIPQACRESWQNMAPIDKGRYCQSCCKTVTDFTVMTNSEIIVHLANKTNSCGRFSGAQLKSINHQLYIQNQQPATQWKRLVLFMAVIGSSINFRAAAQTKPATSKYPVTKQKGKDRSAPIIATQISSNRIITGKVFCDTLAFPGAIVRVKGSDIQTTADANGEYKIEVPANADTLMVSFIGSETAYIEISKSGQTRYDVTLKEDPHLNDTIVVGGIEIADVKPPFYKRIWYKIKHIF